MFFFYFDNEIEITLRCNSSSKKNTLWNGQKKRNSVKLRECTFFLSANNHFRKANKLYKKPIILFKNKKTHTYYWIAYLQHMNELMKMFIIIKTMPITRRTQFYTILTVVSREKICEPIIITWKLKGKRNSLNEIACLWLVLCNFFFLRMAHNDAIVKKLQK